ncbi:hypothetical protein [Armatimonas rosea]|uniref:Uncharacterized protein n=1 Tax=Armatimonas rosea TaxID=685828 RepID=A0A7W9SNX2_ARMRO|nr:hypothetical protein [Armatimonas rosea]MBB6049614.1 hypothetical protein [Armatimonas rosea]
MQETKPLPKRKWVPSGLIRSKELSELSGLAASRRYPGIFWGHNDSGDSSRFFALRADGSVVAEIEVRDAKNHDWEDIALDGKTLYIADMGNNDNKRDNLCVYKLDEPNPSRGDQKVDATKLRVAYPDQSEFPPKKEAWRFDCEAAFVFRGKLHVLTKQRAAGMRFLPLDNTTLYRLDQEDTEKVNVLTKLDSRTQLGGWVTAADLSPDGKTLAVLTHLVASVWLFDVRGATDKLLTKPLQRILLDDAKQCEALCFSDNQTLLLGNEQRELFSLSLAVR